jgi:hypothetical protein
MKRQVIQNFLNLPGISGVALIDGRNRPFFFGSSIRLNSHQQDVLAQGIQQVVDTTPATFNTFSFRFTHQGVHIYKLDQGVILLVLTDVSQPMQVYRSAVKHLIATLMEEPHNVVPTFRLVAGCVTLNGQPSPHGSPDGSLGPIPSTGVSDQGNLVITSQEVVAALNHLSDGAAQYLGKVIVANTWKQARPAQPWLEQFHIQPNGSFSVDGAPPGALTPEQQQWIQDWVAAFVKRGSRTIRNFQSLVSETALTPTEKALLFESAEQSSDPPAMA